MTRYFQTFRLVEPNRTFYDYPRETTVRGRREKAPKDFEFTVKAHQNISHTTRMKVEKLGLEAFDCMKQICKVPDSKILLIQTPGSFSPDKLADAERFLKGVDREDLVLAWETRGAAWGTADAYARLAEVLEELKVGHVTDPFKAMAAYNGKMAYFRLHGLGKKCIITSTPISSFKD